MWISRKELKELRSQIKQMEGKLQSIEQTLERPYSIDSKKVAEALSTVSLKCFLEDEKE